MRTVLSWEHRSTNSAEYITAHLDCGHERTFNGNRPVGSGTVRCWECDKQNEMDDDAIICTKCSYLIDDVDSQTVCPTCEEVFCLDCRKIHADECSVKGDCLDQ